MPGSLLTTASTIQCPHGGRAILTTSNTKGYAQSMPALLDTDVHIVAGCPFTIGSKPSPCVRIEWTAGASRASANGTAVLVESSLGKCHSPEGAMQGVAIIVNTQSKASAQ